SRAPLGPRVRGDVLDRHRELDERGRSGALALQEHGQYLPGSDPGQTKRQIERGDHPLRHPARPGELGRTDRNPAAPARPLPKNDTRRFAADDVLPRICLTAPPKGADTSRFMGDVSAVTSDPPAARPNTEQKNSCRPDPGARALRS